MICAHHNEDGRTYHAQPNIRLSILVEKLFDISRLMNSLPDTQENRSIIRRLENDQMKIGKEVAQYFSFPSPGLVVISDGKELALKSIH